MVFGYGKKPVEWTDTRDCYFTHHSFCARTRTGGKYWNQFAWIGSEPASGYSIMPSSILMPGGDLLWDGTGVGNMWEEEENLRTFPEGLMELAAAETK